jgi:hypothetical protein
MGLKEITYFGNECGKKEMAKKMEINPRTNIIPPEVINRMTNSWE